MERVQLEHQCAKCDYTFKREEPLVCPTCGNNSKFSVKFLEPTAEEPNDASYLDRPKKPDGN